MKKIILATALAMLSALSIAQKKTKVPVQVDRFAGLDTAFERVLKDWHAAGFAVAVVEKNKVVYAKGFGYRDNEKKIPVTPNTLFAIGSCTKAFTASLLGLLQKDGKLSFDKPVRTYLPELHFYNETMNSQILLRDLMCHRTGLPRHDYSWYGFPSTSRDSLLKRIQFMEPNYGVREKWQYNNFMFLLQGMVAEKITAKSWEQNISERFFKPLNMSHSFFSVKDMSKNDDASLGYKVTKDSIIEKLDYYNIDAMGPAGSINSNVLDMANWVSTWINGGKFNDKEIIPAGYIREAMSAQMVSGSALPSKEKPDIFLASYGFGWSLGSYKGHYRVEHGGNIDGFSASTCFFPSDSIGIIVLSNQNGSQVPGVVRNLVADRLLNLSYFDWNTDLKRIADKAKATAKADEKTKTSSRKLNTSPSHMLKEYEGLYSHPGYGTLDVSFLRDSLFVQAGKDRWWLRHYHYDVFEPFDVDPKKGIDTTDTGSLRVQFNMTDAGEISTISLQLEQAVGPLQFSKTVKPKSISKEELSKYLGEYDLGTTIIKLFVKDEKTLFALIPGQPEYELIPVDTDKFAIKILKGYYVLFDVDTEGKAMGLTFLQPNGNFKAKKK